MKLFYSVFIILFSFIGMNVADAARPIPTGNIPELAVDKADVDGTLLFSDSPETVYQDGILYTDTVTGKARLLFYHVNGMKAPRKLAVIVENESGEASDITIDNYSINGPSEYYLDVGKNTLKDYFSNKRVAFIHLAGNEKRLMLPQLSSQQIKTNQLVYGVVEFTAYKPVKVTVIMLPLKSDPLQFMPSADFLPTDRYRLRGTFAGMNRVIEASQPYDPLLDGVKAVTLADGQIDSYRTGVDNSDGRITQNYGNYGILYTIHIPVKAGKKVRYYLNPQAGYYAGALTIRKGKYGQRRMIETPLEQPYFPNDSTNITQYLGTYKSSDDIYIDFSPPGASNLPVRLILVPENY